MRFRKNNLADRQDPAVATPLYFTEHDIRSISFTDASKKTIRLFNNTLAKDRQCTKVLDKEIKILSEDRWEVEQELQYESNMASSNHYSATRSVGKGNSGDALARDKLLHEFLVKNDVNFFKPRDEMEEQLAAEMPHIFSRAQHSVVCPGTEGDAYGPGSGPLVVTSTFSMPVALLSIVPIGHLDQQGFKQKFVTSAGLFTTILCQKYKQDQRTEMFMHVPASLSGLTALAVDSENLYVGCCCREPIQHENEPQLIRTRDDSERQRKSRKDAEGVIAVIPLAQIHSSIANGDKEIFVDPRNILNLSELPSIPGNGAHKTNSFAENKAQAQYKQDKEKYEEQLLRYEQHMTEYREADEAQKRHLLLDKKLQQDGHQQKKARAVSRAAFAAVLASAFATKQAALAIQSYRTVQEGPQRFFNGRVQSHKAIGCCGSHARAPAAPPSVIMIPAPLNASSSATQGNYGASSALHSEYKLEFLRVHGQNSHNQIIRDRCCKNPQVRLSALEFWVCAKDKQGFLVDDPQTGIPAWVQVELVNIRAVTDRTLGMDTLGERVDPLQDRNPRTCWKAPLAPTHYTNAKGNSSPHAQSANQYRKTCLEFRLEMADAVERVKHRINGSASYSASAGVALGYRWATADAGRKGEAGEFGHDIPNAQGECDPVQWVLYEKQAQQGGRSPWGVIDDHSFEVYAPSVDPITCLPVPHPRRAWIPCAADGVGGPHRATNYSKHAGTRYEPERAHGGACLPCFGGPSQRPARSQQDKLSETCRPVPCLGYLPPCIGFYREVTTTRDAFGGGGGRVKDFVTARSAQALLETKLLTFYKVITEANRLQYDPGQKGLQAMVALTVQVRTKAAEERTKAQNEAFSRAEQDLEDETERRSTHGSALALQPHSSMLTPEAAAASVPQLNEDELAHIAELAVNKRLRHFYGVDLRNFHTHVPASIPADTNGYDPRFMRGGGHSAFRERMVRFFSKMEPLNENDINFAQAGEGNRKCMLTEIGGPAISSRLEDWVSSEPNVSSEIEALFNETLRKSYKRNGRAIDLDAFDAQEKRRCGDLAAYGRYLALSRGETSNQVHSKALASAGFGRSLFSHRHSSFYAVVVPPDELPELPLPEGWWTHDGMGYDRRATHNAPPRPSPPKIPHLQQPVYRPEKTSIRAKLMSSSWNPTRTSMRVPFAREIGRPPVPMLVVKVVGAHDLLPTVEGLPLGMDDSLTSPVVEVRLGHKSWEIDDERWLMHTTPVGEMFADDSSQGSCKMIFTPINKATLVGTPVDLAFPPQDCPLNELVVLVLVKDKLKSPGGYSPIGISGAARIELGRTGSRGEALRWVDGEPLPIGDQLQRKAATRNWSTHKKDESVDWMYCTQQLVSSQSAASGAASNASFGSVQLGLRVLMIDVEASNLETRRGQYIPRARQIGGGGGRYGHDTRRPDLPSNVSVVNHSKNEDCLNKRVTSGVACISKDLASVYVDDAKLIRYVDDAGGVVAESWKDLAGLGILVDRKVRQDNSFPASNQQTHKIAVPLSDQQSIEVAMLMVEAAVAELRKTPANNHGSPANRAEIAYDLGYINGGAQNKASVPSLEAALLLLSDTGAAHGWRSWEKLERDTGRAQDDGRSHSALQRDKAHRILTDVRQAFRGSERIVLNVNICRSSNAKGSGGHHLLWAEGAAVMHGVQVGDEISGVDDIPIGECLKEVYRYLGALEARAAFALFLHSHTKTTKTNDAAHVLGQANAAWDAMIGTRYAERLAFHSLARDTFFNTRSKTLKYLDGTPGISTGKKPTPPRAGYIEEHLRIPER
jgi:hypothetical protein